ncbi:MAG TPA: hypothetical protein DIV79_11865 [Opitutae bacterium]|nr:hypothetical protein [Opitutaceae bacterium]HCR30702.1 hypothetical protein [Opitutae bacterium]
MAGSNCAMRQIPAFCFSILVVLVFATSTLEGQRRVTRISPLDTVGEAPSQKLGWEILKQFQSMGWDGGYRWRIQLKIMPRREKSRYINGIMYGDRNAQGPISRIDIIERPADVDSEGNHIQASVLRLLLQSGGNAYAMQLHSSEPGPPIAIESDTMLENIAGSEFSLFDIMAPYVYWPRFEYEGRRTFRGGPTHLFWMYPPDEDNLLREKIGGVRLHISDQFNVLTQTEIFDTQGEKLKTIYISGVKKVDGQAIFSGMDARNEITRDKTRLRILDATMGLELPSSLFQAQSLIDDLQNQRIPDVRLEDFQSVE